MPPYPEYHRPSTLEAALALLSRPSPITRPLAGGTHLGHVAVPQEAVIDLCDLPLGEIKRAGPAWFLGATTTLEVLTQASGLPPALQRAARRQSSRNVRQRATVGGAIASADSGPLLVCLLALQAQIHLEPGARIVGLIDYLAGQSEARWERALIVGLSFDAARRVGLAEVTRTPADVPLLCAAVAAIPANKVLTQVSVAVGAAGQPLAPCAQVTHWLEGHPVRPLSSQIPETAIEAIAWKDDVRASGHYRQAILPELVQRACAELASACEETHHEG
jgi:CO/xanthine dehydrogenase FAD-binding subunit